LHFCKKGFVENERQKQKLRVCQDRVPRFCVKTSHYGWPVALRVTSLCQQIFFNRMADAWISHFWRQRSQIFHCWFGTRSEPQPYDKKWKKRGGTTRNQKSLKIHAQSKINKSSQKCYKQHFDAQKIQNRFHKIWVACGYEISRDFAKFYIPNTFKVADKTFWIYIT
jgi:hypothetical protein